MFGLFKKKDYQKENEILLNRLEQYAKERAVLKQIISDTIQDNDVDICDFMLTEKFESKYRGYTRKTELKGVWIILEKWCIEQNNKSK
jgi:hypothetical protein